MKIVKVTYTTRPDYAPQNQNNIRAVMDALKTLNRPGINYNVCLAPDGHTFIHTAFMQTDDDQKALNDLPAFKHFIEQLKASAPLTGPKQELLTLVASSVNIFNI